MYVYRLLAVINTKLPEIGELLLKRVIFQFRRAYKRRDKIVATALVRFIAHLVNQQVSYRGRTNDHDDPATTLVMVMILFTCVMAVSTGGT